MTTTKQQTRVLPSLLSRLHKTKSGIYKTDDEVMIIKTSMLSEQLCFGFFWFGFFFDHAEKRLLLFFVKTVVASYKVCVIPRINEYIFGVVSL